MAWEGKTGAGLVSFCRDALNAGCGYVYGAYGQICTLSLRQYYARQYPDYDLAGGPMFTAAAKWDGRRVVDCSGLISYYLTVSGYGQNPPRRVLVHYTQAKQIAPIGSLPEVPGTLLWQPGHVGVYIGNGRVIEARGTVYGVVETPLNGRGWKKWWYNQEIDFTSNAVYNSAPILNPQTFISVGIETPGARSLGHTTGVTNNKRSVYELIIRALASNADMPFTTLTNSLQSSTSGVSNANGRVDPDPGEGHISANANTITSRYLSLLSQTTSMQNRLNALSERVAALAKKVLSN